MFREEYDGKLDGEIPGDAVPYISTATPLNKSLTLQ